MESVSVVRLKDNENNTSEVRFAAIDEKDNIVGLIRLENEMGAISITDIYVEPDARRQGIGTYLLQSVLNMIGDIDLFLNVEIRFPLDDDTRELYEFIKFQDNFTVTEEDKVFHVSAKDRKKLKVWSKLAGNSTDAKPFFEMSKKQIKEFYKKMRELDHDEPIPEDEETLEKNLCFARIENNNVIGALFVQRYEAAKQLMVSFIYSEGDGPATLSNLISAAAEVAENEYKDYEFIFTSENPKIFGMVDGIFEGKVTVSPFVTATWDGLSINAIDFLTEQAI
ncbi:MAG: GNAT family N-acetyltransferase [Lachnospiraceae bacterium]|nr:GNAT family N-acetyltransferase [Lachnospiraceae bacterium]MBP5746448.1 GNAT family N-acetyltransferase [Lachnospiraceae bacterium]